MPRYEVTDELLHAIEDVVAAGANSTREIAQFLEIPYQTYRNLSEGRRKKNGAEEMDKIGQAFNRGLARQIPRMLSAAETALMRKVTGESWLEVAKEVRVYKWLQKQVDRGTKKKPDLCWELVIDEQGYKIPLLDENGEQEYIVVGREFREKSRAPSDTAIKFTLVNASRILAEEGETPRWLGETSQPDLLPPAIGEDDDFDGFDFIEITDEEAEEIQARVNSIPPEEREI